MKERVDYLSARSVDGSEATSSQWELELQASVQKLNTLPMKSCTSDQTDCVTRIDSKVVQVDKCSENNYIAASSEKSSNESSNDRRKQFDIIQGWQSLAQTPINSLISRSKIALKNSLSKSLSNSPVTSGPFSFVKTKALDLQIESDQPSSNLFDKNLQQTCANESSTQSTSEESSAKTNCSGNQIDNLCEEDNVNFLERNDINEDSSLKKESRSRPSNLLIDDTQVQNIIKTTHSLDSTPVKVKSLSSSMFASSLISGLNGKVKRAQNDTQTDCSSSKAKELPLLSFFQKSTVLMPPKDKSCSMINLNEKQNLKTLLDNSDLGNIQAASVEKLANARSKLVGD